MMENALKTWHVIAPVAYFDWKIRMYFQGGVKGIKPPTSINSNIKVPIHSWRQREDFLSMFICLYFITMGTLQNPCKSMEEAREILQSRLKKYNGIIRKA